MFTCVPCMSLATSVPLRFEILKMLLPQNIFAKGKEHCSINVPVSAILCDSAVLIKVNSPFVH